MKIRDKYGYPVEVFKGRPITNFIRYIIHVDVLLTLHYWFVGEK